MRGGAGDHLPRLRSGLQPGCGVDDRPGHEQLPARVAPHSRFAGFDPDPDLEWFVQAGCLPQPAGPGPDGEPGADRAQRVVLVYDR